MLSRFEKFFRRLFFVALCFLDRGGGGHASHVEISACHGRFNFRLHLGIEMFDGGRNLDGRC